MRAGEDRAAELVLPVATGSATFEWIGVASLEKPSLSERDPGLKCCRHSEQGASNAVVARAFSERLATNKGWDPPAKQAEKKDP